MYSRLSTWQTTDHLTLFMNLLWVMVWIYPRSSLHPSRVVRSLQEGSLPLPKYTRQGLGEVGTEFYINIQYEFLLRNWIKLALRWLSTLGEKAPTRFKKKKKKITPVLYRSNHFWGNHPKLKMRNVCSAIHFSSPVCCPGFTPVKASLSHCLVTAETGKTCRCSELLNYCCGLSLTGKT